MQSEDPTPEAAPLVLGLIQVNPHRGRQDGGQAQETAMQRVATVIQEPLVAQ